MALVARTFPGCGWRSQPSDTEGKGKGKVHPRTGHEVTGGGDGRSSAIVLLIL